MSWGYDLIFDAKMDEEWVRATRFTLANSAVMIGDCDTIRQLAISYGMMDERIVTFPWGIDLDRFIPSTNPGKKTDQPFTLLSTRGWEPIYGIEVIARAFVSAVRENPDLRLIMLGGGSQEVKIKTIFRDNAVMDRVEFPGQVAQEKLPDIFRQADLYVSASHSDGTSISLLEAMASGCPVLVSDIPGNLEWVKPGVHGFIFPDGDHTAMAQQILHAAHSREKLLPMGKNGRKLAEQRADWDKNFDKLLYAYDLAMQQKVM